MARPTQKNVVTRRPATNWTLCCAASVLGLHAALAIHAQHAPQQVNTELLGRGVGSVRQSGLASLGNVPWNLGKLSSEYRNDAVLSGRLRSEFRGEYLARGPLAPGGLQAYIPTTPGPYGAASPYTLRPRPIATVPGGMGPSSPRGGAVAATPRTQLGVVSGFGGSGGGSLRLAPAAPVPVGPTPAAPGVAPPLVRMNYGSLRPSASVPSLQPGLTLPPPLPSE